MLPYLTQTYFTLSNTSARGEQSRQRKPVITVGRTRWHSRVLPLPLGVRYPLISSRPNVLPRHFFRLPVANLHDLVHGVPETCSRSRLNATKAM